MIEAEAIENGKLRVYMQKFLFLQAKQGGHLQYSCGGIYRRQILPQPQMQRSKMQWSIYKTHNLFVIFFLCQEKLTHIYFTQPVHSRLKTSYIINQPECVAKRLQWRQIYR